MRIFNTPVRVINNDTLETLGTYEPTQLIIREPGETVWALKLKHRIYILLTVALMLIGFFLIIGVQGGEVHKLKQEIAHYEELTGMNLPYISVEALAGKYATYKGKVPSNKDTIFKFICESGAWYPEVIMAQFQLESKLMTSDVGKNAINGFGMKKCGEGPRSRPNLQIRGMDYHGYGMYMNWYHSVLDRILWDLWVFSDKPATREAYLKGLIDKRYAEDPDYISKISQIASQWAEKTSNYIDPDHPKDTVKSKP